jgi:2-polyprenyl-3-methyl-5-hydroxy-6-metoxy-1,4-benzoquinol methylase
MDKPETSKNPKELNMDKFYNEDCFDGESGALAFYHGYTFDKLETGFKHKIRTIQSRVATGKLLDVGCAKGFFVRIALEAGYDAYGIDFSEYAISKARDIVGNRAQKIDIEKTNAYPPESFDIITAWDFIEHLKDPEAFLKKASTILKQNGYLFLTTVNYSSLMARLMRRHWRFIGPLHISYKITPKLLGEWLRNANFHQSQIGTSSLCLKPLPQRLKMIQYALTAVISAATPILNATNLGDIILCTAQKRK